MDEEAKKVLTELISNLIDRDHGIILAMQVIVHLLIENGSLTEEQLLNKIDEAHQKFELDKLDKNFTAALLSLGNSVSPNRYAQGDKNELLSFLKEWNPSGNKH